MYEKLMNYGAYSQNEILRRISAEYGGVSRTTLRTYLFSRDRQKKKERNAERAQKEKSDPEVIKSRNIRSARRMRVYRHIDAVITDVYNGSERDELSLQEIAMAIYEAEQVKISPRTISRIAIDRRKEHGQTPLLEEIADSELYRLSHLLISL